MLVILGSRDHFLSNHLGRLLDAVGLRKIRTVKMDRILRELKQPERMAILDMSWKELQAPGLLRRLVNIAKISRNKVVLFCPNDEEELKKQARQARPNEVFIRYDIELEFRAFLNEIVKEELKNPGRGTNI